MLRASGAKSQCSPRFQKRNQTVAKPSTDRIFVSAIAGCLTHAASRRHTFASYKHNKKAHLSFLRRDRGRSHTRSRATQGFPASMRPTGGLRMIYFLACIAAIAGFLFGYDEGVIAVARPLLDKDFPMSPVVGGFMTAAVPLGALVGASVAGRITDRYGRRRVLMAAAALFAVGALIAAGMTATWILVAARLALGLAIGVAAVTAPLYISEAAPVAIRGGLVATYQLAITFGILVSYLTGLAIEGDGMWRVMFGLGAVPGLLFLLGLAFLPESPRWLMLKHLS